MVPVDALIAPGAEVPPVQVPVMFRVPVDTFDAPVELLPALPKQFPVIFIVPVELFCAPGLKVPPVQVPVMFIVPVTLLFTPAPLEPPVQLPLIFSIPEDALLAANDELTLPPRQFPTICAEFPAVPEKTTVATLTVEPPKTFAVSVTPLERVNDPAAVAPPNVSLRTSPVAPRLVETLTVMANEFAMRTSPAANVTADAVPAGAVAQTSVALMFPALRAK
jgi:hypothetical protein